MCGVCVFKKMSCIYTVCGCVAGLKFDCSIYAGGFSSKHGFARL